MLIKTKILLILLFLLNGNVFLKAQAVNYNDVTNKNKKELRAFKKRKKLATKQFWSMQTKDARKRVKASNKKQISHYSNREKANWDAF